MLKPLITATAMAALLVASGCGDDNAAPVPTPTPVPTPAPTPTPSPADVTLDIDFGTPPPDFTFDFSDCSGGPDTPADESTCDINEAVEIRDLPDGLDGRGLFVGATNRSDDLFAYVYALVSGADPDTEYMADIELTFATNIPSNCLGVGGPPGESVIVAGAVLSEAPFSVFVDDQPGSPPERVLPLDKVGEGGLGTDGEDIAALGDFATPGEDCDMDDGEYALKTVSDRSPRSVISDSNGNVYVLFGTDSGFEDRTEIYYVSATIELTPVGD